MVYFLKFGLRQGLKLEDVLNGIDVKEYFQKSPKLKQVFLEHIDIVSIAKAPNSHMPKSNRL